jgi:hypothetical protein
VVPELKANARLQGDAQICGGATADDAILPLRMADGVKAMLGIRG